MTVNLRRGLEVHHIPLRGLTHKNVMRRKWFRPVAVSPPDGQRPSDDRHCFEGLLWMLHFGATRRAVPKGYPSATTCWRRPRVGGDSRGGQPDADTLENIWRVLLTTLDEQGRLDWEECFADATFIPAKKGGACIGKIKGGKGTKLAVVAYGQGVPLGLSVDSASPHECTLVGTTLEEVKVPRKDRRCKPRAIVRLIYGRAADSDPLRRRLAERGVDVICPHRKNRKKHRLQDCRKLRRYQ